MELAQKTNQPYLQKWKSKRYNATKCKKDCLTVTPQNARSCDDGGITHLVRYNEHIIAASFVLLPLEPVNSNCIGYLQRSITWSKGDQTTAHEPLPARRPV